MAQRYAGEADAIEVWNEENIGHFWNGSANPAAYAQLLKTAYPAIKAGNPNMTVLFGGLSTNDWQWLQSVYDAAPDIGNYFDVMATHPYTPQAPPDAVTWDDAQHIDRMSFSGYRTVRQVMLDHGNDKPIWFTEFGWSTTSQPGWGVTAQQQADYTKEAWQCVQQDGYVQVAIMYELRNNYWASNADDWDDQLGLTYVNFSHKPAYDSFKSVDPSQGGCTYGGAAGSPPGTTSGSGSGAGSTTGSGSGSTSGQSGAGSAGTGSAGHEITVHVRRAKRVSSASARHAVKLTVVGKVAHASGGRVVLRFERSTRGGRWHRVRSLTLAVARDGRFRHGLHARGLGRWRVRAMYAGPPAPAASRFAYFRL